MITLRDRSAGVLLHLTSLPGPHGAGDLGPEALRFVDFLAAAGQRWWQMLPVGPTMVGNAPYTSPSSFSGSPLLISLERLDEDGLLGRDDVAPDRGFSDDRVRYELAEPWKEERLRRAFAAFERRGGDPASTAFARENGSWLDDWALYAALKRARGDAPWTEWEPDARDRRPEAIARLRGEFAREIRYQQFVQFVFARQWEALREHCARRGVRLIGDIPIFVSHDSADVWTHPELFHLDTHGRPTDVAGVPPDYFSRTGQLWGNPLYRWEIHRETGFEWWVERLRLAFRRFDAVRLDHFIGFHRTWAVPAGDRTAEHGRWWEGPGDTLFDAVKQRLGDVEIIAEDLGLVTAEVTALRERFGFPGLRVLQFSFWEGPEASNHRPHAYPRRCVVYTGTHDNDTIAGWYHERAIPGSARTQEQIDRERAVVRHYIGADGREIHWGMIRVALASMADLAIVPAQDLLGLGSEARMNTPGTVGGNWEWRLQKGALTEEIAARMKKLTEGTGR